MRLLASMAKATGVSIVREDIATPAAFVQSRQSRAVEAIRARRYDTAVRDLKDSLLVVPDDALTWTQLGSAHFASGDKEKAFDAYRKALTLNPADVKLRGFVETNFPRKL
jgi:cytochrome c-type biogenesis protein CcmH/NrfG